VVEIIESPKTEIPSSVEAPRYTTTVAFPKIPIEGEDMRLMLGMHTDSILTLLKTLNNLPDLDQIKIEGRVLTTKQQSLLVDDPIYNFYLLGRISRASVLSFPEDLNIKPEEALSLFEIPFTPSILSDKIGHKNGYFSAKQLVFYWTETGLPNDLLPILGGINEFRIGSDTLLKERLFQITGQISQAFIEQELSSPAVSTTKLTTLVNIRHFLNLPVNPSKQESLWIPDAPTTTSFDQI